MRTSSILSILNTSSGNSYASLRSLSITLEHEVCRAVGCQSLNLIAWDEVWKLYCDGRWSCILPTTDEICTCDQHHSRPSLTRASAAAAADAKKASCCFLTEVYQELKYWKFVFFRPSKLKEICKILKVNSDNQPAGGSGGKRQGRRESTQQHHESSQDHESAASGGDQGHGDQTRAESHPLHTTHADRTESPHGRSRHHRSHTESRSGASSKHGEYLLVVKLSPARLDRFLPKENAKSGLLVARIQESITPNTPPILLAKTAHMIATRLIESVSTAYHTSLNTERMAKHLAENTFILTLTRITSHLTHTRVVDVFSRIDSALKNFRHLRLSAILAVDDVNRELVQVWHNKDGDCMECKPISIDCDSIQRCLFHGEAQIVSLSQARSMNRLSPQRHQRRLFGDSSERHHTHRPSTSGVVGVSLIPPPMNSECLPTIPSLLGDDVGGGPPTTPSLSPAFLSKVHGCTLRTAKEKQGCRLLAPLVGPNGTAKVVMVIDRKYSQVLATSEDTNLGSTTDYDTFMSPSLFRVLQEMVRTLGTTTLHSVISDYVMTTLVTQNQKRRESAPSHCIIEYVYGVIPTQREEPPLLEPTITTPTAEVVAVLDDVAENEEVLASSSLLRPSSRRIRRASAPITCASQLIDVNGSSSLSNDNSAALLQWDAVCLDYFSMTNDQFFEFFDYSLAEYEHVVMPSTMGVGHTADRRSERIRRRAFFDFVMNAYLEANPYHNKYHAVQVLHVSWQMIGMMAETLLVKKGEKTDRHAHSTDLPLASSFSNEDPPTIMRRSAAKHHSSMPSTSVSPVFDELAYALLLASILHDIDHIGVSNNYLISISHPLSILYNDHAVLEQHHCAFIFNAFNQRKQIDLTKQSRTLRKLMIEMILATDMAKHTSLISSLTQLAANSCLEAFNEEEWAKFGQILLHASDLSNQLTPFPYFVRWAGLCIDEFNRQVNMEIENGLTITSYMNCRTDSSRIEMELGFLEFVVLPVWQPLAILEPKMTQWLETGAQNSQFWRDCLKELNGTDHHDNTKGGGGGGALNTRPSPEDSSEDAVVVVGPEKEAEDMISTPQNSIAREFIDLWQRTGKSLFELEAQRR